ncbi:hypothetical protein TEA_019585 [Camellia sinensis var. sinensis]|uniref:Uncharacterized protein n=1 Tax=Camellia sinensis var. sinensis TaxID=542762 RepID=A0A4S4DS20_CAMSN|nr:hypothetical protein TEA_019585 [Camellia sinensis var. sinensis]
MIILEAFMEMCTDEYVQKMTFDSYLYKKVALGNPLEDLKLAVNTIGSLVRARKREREMEKMMNVLKPKPNPQQQLRDWQRRLRQECRNIERQIRDIQREEKSVQKAIKEAAKRNDMGSAKKNTSKERKIFLRDTIDGNILSGRLKGPYTRLQWKFLLVLMSVLISPNSNCIETLQSAIARTVGHLSKSAEVMKLVNNLMKAPEVGITMQEFSKEMIKSGIIEETVNDAVDSALDSEDIEEEIEEEVDKVLTALAGETAAQLPEAVRKEKLKQPARVAGAELEDEAIAEGADDEEELEEIRARLARVRS